MGMRDTQDKPQMKEPILKQENVKLEIVSTEGSEWKHKPETGSNGVTKAMKLSLRVVDDSAHCENGDAQPGLINDQMNLEHHPYVSKKTGQVAKMGRGQLYSLERALGFDPYFVDANGHKVAPHITRSGNKVCPKGAVQQINPDFADAYFDMNDQPKFGAFEGKTVYADVDVETDETYGSKNVIKRYRENPEL